MKKLLLILLFPLTLFSQEKYTSTVYGELNAGIAFLGGLDGLPFPGCSALLGTTMNYRGFLVDVEGGAALPTIWTAKLGIGAQVKQHQITAGIRPYPMHFYLQNAATDKKWGSFLISIEIGAEALGNFNSFESLGMITFGWRFTLATY
jgi:hypothetical protein